jgi:tetratricopeptide (TPR) repeat protein
MYTPFFNKKLTGNLRPMSKENQVIIERDKKFSESSLWDFQRAYFDKEGVNAWIKSVPHYVTSNPFLANCYAQMTVRLAQDWVKKYPDAQNHPFYIMELGTGTGQLSFYILKKIKQLKKQLRLEHLNICYLMTDFTESNVQFWEKHPALQEFIDNKMLDFAIFDMEKDSEVTLRKSGIKLTAGSIVNPLTVYANYIFDTVSSDLFTIKNGEIYASLVSLSTTADNLHHGKPVSMEKIKLSYKTADISENYYEDPHFNAVLAEHKKVIKNSNIVFPIAGLRTTVNLKKLSGGKIFLVSSDKGYAAAADLENLGHPYIDFHGSFSLMVNFYAIAQYFEKSGGKAVMQTIRPGIKTNVFYHGFDLEDLPEFALSIYEHTERLSPGDYFVMHRNIRDNFKYAPIESLIGHMAFTHWDPHIYRKITKQICEQAPSANKDAVNYLVKHLPDIAANFYYMPQAYDVHFDLGLLLHNLRRYAEAIPYYENSRHHYGDRFDLVYNLAICEYHAGMVDRALENFKSALTFRPDSSEAKQFIDYIKNTEGKNI